MKNKKALFFSDGDGMFTIGIETKEEAISLMDKIFNDPLEDYKSDYGDIIFNEETVKESYYYHHTTCGYYTIEENLCGECGEECKGKSWKTFTINF